MVSRKAKIAPRLQSQHIEKTMGLLGYWDYCFVIITEPTPEIPGSLPTQAPGRVGLATHWVRPPGPLFLPKPSPAQEDTYRHKDPRNNQETKIPFSLSLEKIPKGLDFKFSVQEMFPCHLLTRIFAAMGLWSIDRHCSQCQYHHLTSLTLTFPVPGSI